MLPLIQSASWLQNQLPGLVDPIRHGHGPMGPGLGTLGMGPGLVDPKVDPYGMPRKFIISLWESHFQIVDVNWIS